MLLNTLTHYLEIIARLFVINGIPLVGNLSKLSVGVFYFDSGIKSVMSDEAMVGSLCTGTLH